MRYMCLHIFLSIAGCPIDFIIDLGECFVTLVLVAHLVVEAVIKHLVELVSRQVGVCVQHLKTTITNTHI